MSDGAPSLLRYVRYAQDGTPTVHEASVRDLSRELGVPFVDVANLRSRTRKPRIAAASSTCIVVRVSSVQALITPEHLSLFCVPTAAGLQAFYDDVEALLSRDTFSSAAAFERRALEAVMVAVLARYRRRYHIVEPLARACMSRMTSASTESGLSSADGIGWLWRLLPLRESLGSFEAHLRGLSATLEDALSSDEHMLRMMLTERKRLLPDELPPAELHEVMETMLERYFRECSDMHEHVSLLRQSIETAVETLNTALDASRNRLIAVNLRLSIGMVGLSASALGASTFGMNLQSGLEEWPYGLWVVAGGLGTASVMAYRTISSAVRSSASVHCQTADAEAVRSVYQHADDVAEEVRDHARSGGAALTREDLTTLLKRSTGGTRVSEADLDLLMDALDQARARYHR